MSAVPATIGSQPPSLLAKLADRFSVDPAKMMGTLKATAFKGEVSNEQLMALLIVADQYGLNPFTKEIYAFPDKGGVVPVVGVDGWARIINQHPAFDGMDYADGPTGKDGLPEWIECAIYRRDRSHPVKVREYMAECKRGTQPWNSHPRRMLRHKSTIQAARMAFGFVGIYDEDEAQRIVGGGMKDITPARQPSAVAAINRQIAPPVVESRAPSFDDVAAMITEAATADALAEIRNIVPSVESDDDREELEGLLAVREAELASK
ncbi:MAG: hypothetical protein RL756_686 [Pseudomonadota bacterium]|jgi:phage recombination protein Bet